MTGAPSEKTTSETVATSTSTSTSSTGALRRPPTATPWPLIRIGLVLTAALAVPAVGIAVAVDGQAGALGALLGLAVVAAFFVISKVVVGTVANRAPHLLLPAAMGTYVVKILLLGALLVTVDDVQAVNALAMAWSVFVGVFAWMGVELWFATHTRVPFYDPATFRARSGGDSGVPAADEPVPERPASTTRRP